MGKLYHSGTHEAFTLPQHRSETLFLENDTAAGDRFDRRERRWPDCI
jgi:hypothetical protein